ncbi:PREDICTED: uncharacterized protein LOC109168419 [Ipomoea nil]|uniref:uncharacterized protein LOC109168419 n=1 Tax=Ipomoea nil TaxID=35883 RepID=UPI000901AF1E|nr:PREDICTED: uncharacterized protein LOC109168419 [Ipomoea nil]
MNIVSWNCQGAASSGFRRALHMLVRKHEVDVVGLLEPRISGNSADKACKSFGFENWIRVEAVGFSGGIWILWNDGVRVEIVATNPQYILTRIGKNNKNFGIVSFVYGSPSSCYRKKLWEGLSTDNFHMHEGWLAVGDFNAVTCMEDVSNQQNFSNHRCVGMNEWIFKEGLIDMGFVGPRFTWTRGRESTTFTGARLDQALCNLDWITQHPGTKVSHITRVCSDHSPLLIELGRKMETPKGPGFLFQAAWTIHEGFRQVTEDCWDCDKPIMENIHSMQAGYEEWNTVVFGNIEKRKRKLMSRIDVIQRAMGCQPTNGLIKLERKLRSELEETLHQEEIKWLQKSKEDWIQSGDRNTRFYHAATKVRQTRNKVHGLKNDKDEWVHDRKAIEVMILSYYKLLYAREDRDFNFEVCTSKFPIIDERK